MRPGIGRSAQYVFCELSNVRHDLKPPLNVHFGSCHQLSPWLPPSVLMQKNAPSNRCDGEPARARRARCTREGVRWGAEPLQTGLQHARRGGWWRCSRATHQ